MNKNLNINTENLAYNEKIIISERQDGVFEITKEPVEMQHHDRFLRLILVLFVALVLFLVFAGNPSDSTAEPQTTSQPVSTIQKGAYSFR